MPRPKAPRSENDPKKLIEKQNTVPQVPAINFADGDSIRKSLSGTSAEALKPGTFFGVVYTLNRLKSLVFSLNRSPKSVDDPSQGAAHP